MPRLSAIATVAVVALLLAGCAAGESPAPGGGTPTSAASTSAAPLLLGPVGLAEVDGTAWVAWSASGAVSPLDADGKPGEAVAVGDTPLRMVALDGSLWVTTFADGRLVEVDAATGMVGRTVDVGEEPEGVTVFDGHLFVVLQKEASLVEVDPETGDVLARYDVGGEPRLVTGGVDSLFVTDFGGGRIVRVTPSTGSVTASKPVCPGAQDVAYVDGTVYASCMGKDVVVGLDTATLAVVETIKVPGDPDGLTVGARGAGATLLVGLQEGPAVAIVDLHERSVAPLYDAASGNLRDRSNVDVLWHDGSILMTDAIGDIVTVLTIEASVR